MKSKDVFGILDYATLVIIGSGINVWVGIGIAISHLFIESVLVADLRVTTVWLKFFMISVGTIIAILYPVITEILIAVTALFMIAAGIVYVYLKVKLFTIEYVRKTVLLEGYEGR